MFSMINFVRMAHEGWLKNGSSFVPKWMKFVAPIIDHLLALPFVKNTWGFLSSSSLLCFGQLFVEAPSC